jgi:Domain of unknown function (DUF4192)
MDPEHNEAHLRLWADVTRLAQPGYVAPPAALLAFTAWQSGNGTFANTALDRAPADRPQATSMTTARQSTRLPTPQALTKPLRP